METNQIEEIRKGLADIGAGIKTNRELIDKTAGEVAAGAQLVREINEENAKLRADLDVLRKAALTRQNQPRVLKPGQEVSEDCARYLAAVLIANGDAQKKLPGGLEGERLRDVAREALGIAQKTALTTTDIPMPTIFQGEVVELVYKYGQFRKYATTFPLPTLTTKLPKLATDPAFGFVAMSAAIGEKSPQVSFVTFTAQKMAGIVRIPNELSADSVVSLGAFVARYIARQTALWEDTVGFLADGTGTYNSISGVGKKADTLTYKIQLGAGNGKPSNIALADMRSLRAKVSGAVLPNAAYYLHPSMEAQLVSFNTSATVTPYIANGPNGPTLDGFPVRWVSVMPVYQNTTNTFNAYQVYFGDMSYWYFGDRMDLAVTVSNDIYFATDEIGIRAIERFDCELMADASMAVLLLSAS